MPRNEVMISRYGIYTILIDYFIDYKGSNEYYELENFLAKKLNCDCTDCGGSDISRKCNVEKFFYSKCSYIKRNTMV